MDKQLYTNNYRESSAPYQTETGCSAGAPSSSINSNSCPHPYPLQTSEAMGARTTGNVYGIYDMSGGVYEYVMGNMVGNSSPIGTFHNNSSSGKWDVVPGIKYYESYAYDTDYLTHGRGHLGDATKEVLLEFGTNSNGGWYGDRSRLPSSTTIWVVRGGRASDASQTGAFAFLRDTGNATYYYGFRAVIVLQ